MHQNIQRKNDARTSFKNSWKIVAWTTKNLCSYLFHILLLKVLVLIFSSFRSVMLPNLSHLGMANPQSSHSQTLVHAQKWNKLKCHNFWMLAVSLLISTTIDNVSQQYCRLWPTCPPNTLEWKSTLTPPSNWPHRKPVGFSSSGHYICKENRMGFLRVFESHMSFLSPFPYLSLKAHIIRCSSW